MIKAERMTDETIEMKETELVVEQSPKKFDDVDSAWINIFGYPINTLNDFVVYTIKNDDEK